MASRPVAYRPHIAARNARNARNELMRSTRVVLQRRSNGVVRLLEWLGLAVDANAKKEVKARNDVSYW